MNVLVWGTSDGPCAFYRGDMFKDLWADLGVTYRVADIRTKIDLLTADGEKVPDGPRPDDLRDRLADGTYRLEVDVDTEPVKWADVVLFRRDYNTTWACSLDVSECDFRSEDIHEALKHPHQLQKRRDTATLPIWRALQQVTPGERPAIVYDTDDFLIADKKMTWNGLWADYWAHRHLCREMAEKADLVTVTTPTLAWYYRGTNPNIRVIRNAIKPDLYRTEVPRPERTKPVMLYYGSAVRMRDYAGYGDVMGKARGGFAHKAAEDLRPILSTMFLGAEPGYEAKVRSYGFDEVRGKVAGIPFFAMALASTHADIGIAPLWGDEFDACKSELHWLEYAAVGAAVVADRMDGKGPYAPIRHGIDGLLVKGRQEWYDALRKLAREPAYRADMAAAAKERVLAEYDYRVRAADWVEAFQWALEHKGERVDKESGGA